MARAQNNTGGGGGNRRERGRRPEDENRDQERPESGPSRQEAEANKKEAYRALNMMRLRDGEGFGGPLNRYEKDAITEILNHHHLPEDVLNRHAGDLREDLVERITRLGEALRSIYASEGGQGDVFQAAEQQRHEGAPRVYTIDDGTGNPQRVEVSAGGGVPIIINNTNTASPIINVGGAGDGEGENTQPVENADETAEEEQQEPTIEVQPRELQFGTEHQELQFAISNPGDGEMSWTIEGVLDGITVSAADGTEPADVTVTVNRAAFGVGMYTGFFRVVPGEGDPIDVNYSVEVVEGNVPDANLFLRRHLNQAKVEAEMRGRTPAASEEEIATALEQAKFAEYREVADDEQITEKIHNLIDVIRRSASSLRNIEDADLALIAEKTGLSPERVKEIAEGEFARLTQEAEKTARSKKLKRKGVWSRLRGIAVHPVTGVVAGAALGLGGFLPATMIAAGVGIQRGLSLWGKYSREQKEIKAEKEKLQDGLANPASAVHRRLEQRFRTDIATAKQLEIDGNAQEERELNLEGAREEYLKNWKREKVWKKDREQQQAARGEYLGRLGDQREVYERQVRAYLDNSPEWANAPESKKILYMKAVGTLFEQDARQQLSEHELAAQFGGEGKRGKAYEKFYSWCEKNAAFHVAPNKSKRDLATGLIFTGARFVAHNDSVLKPIFGAYGGWKIGGAAMDRWNKKKYRELQEVTIDDLRGLDAPGALPDVSRQKLFPEGKREGLRGLFRRPPSEDAYKEALLAKAREQVANPRFRKKHQTEYAQLCEYIRAHDTKKLAVDAASKIAALNDDAEQANDLALEMAAGSAQRSAESTERAAHSRERRKKLEGKTRRRRRTGKTLGAVIGAGFGDDVAQAAVEKWADFGIDMPDLTPDWLDEAAEGAKEAVGEYAQKAKEIVEDIGEQAADIAEKQFEAIQELLKQYPQIAEYAEKAGKWVDDKRYWWRRLPPGWWEGSEGGKVAKDALIKMFPELEEGTGGSNGVAPDARPDENDDVIADDEPDTFDDNDDAGSGDPDQSTGPESPFQIQPQQPDATPDNTGPGLLYDPDVHGPDADPDQGKIGLKIPKEKPPAFDLDKPGVGGGVPDSGSGGGTPDLADGEPDTTDDGIILGDGEPDTFDDAPDAQIDKQPLDAVEYQGGKHVWGEIEKQMPHRVGYSELWDKLGEGDADVAEAGKTHAIDFLKDKVVEAARENPALYNIPEGVDIDHLTAKQLSEIDWDRLFHDHRGELAQVFRDLDPAEVANIVANNEALQKWAALHPDATLESDAGEKNFVDDVIREMRGGGAGVGAQDLEPVRGVFESSGDWETDVEAAISDASSPQEVYDAINGLGADYVKVYESELSDLLTEKFAELGYGEDIKVVSIWTNADGIESVTVHYAGDAEVRMSVGMADGPEVVEQMMKQGGELKAFFDGHPQYNISHPQGIEIHSYGQTFHGFVLDLPGGNDGAITLEIAGDPPMLRSFGVPQGTYPEDLPEGVVNKLIWLHDKELVGNEGAFKGLEDELKNQAYLARTMHGLEEKVLNPDQHTNMVQAAKLYRDLIHEHPDAAYYLQNDVAAAYVTKLHPDMQEHFDRLKSGGANVAVPASAPESSESFTPVEEAAVVSAESSESSGESEPAQEEVSPGGSPEAARLKVVFEKLAADLGGSNELQEALLDNVEENVGYSREVIEGHLQALAKEPDIPSAVTRMSPERLQVLASVVEIIPDSYLSAMDKAVFGEIIDQVAAQKAQ